MLKASALYMVIIIALVIGLLCSSLVVVAYFYKTEYQRKFRRDQLISNLGSGVNILLATTDTSYSKERTFDLFGNSVDSVSLQRVPWGVYDVGIAKAFIQQDTLFQVFSMANMVDSSKWAALYLMDEQRPFSLSGKTTVRGDVYIPEAGVKQAYIDNMAYQGDKRLIIGNKHVSQKKLPALDDKLLSRLEQYINQDHSTDRETLPGDSVQQSFLRPARIVNFGKVVQTISNTKIEGNVVLFSDTTLIIDSTATLINVLVFAKAIKIKSGFHGQVQLFATDSVKVDSNCNFMYPSCIGILRFQNPPSTQTKIMIGSNTLFSGLIFTYEKLEQPVKPLIEIGRNVTVKGQIYSQGILQLNDKSEIEGSVFTSRFLYKGSSTLYENYLINTTIDSKALSPYYLSSELVPVTSKNKKVLQWLERN